MNVYAVCGRISGLTSIWMKRLGWKNIKSIKPSYSNDIVIEMKDGPDAGIKFLEPGSACIVWSVQDFEHRAAERWEYHTNRDPIVEQTCWQDVYDESKFEAALQQMIHKHDATLGISWDTIDFWLDEMCLKQ